MEPRNDQPSNAPSPELPAVARKMRDDDRAVHAAGIELIEVRAGYARLRMRVRRQQLNAVQVCHGGNIFMLADTAFAFACNSRNQKTLAAAASIEFVAPAHENDLLTAECTELHLGGRSGVYDVRITNQDGELVALFRGRSATIKGRYLEDSEAAGPAAATRGPADAASGSTDAAPGSTNAAPGSAEATPDSVEIATPDSAAPNSVKPASDSATAPPRSSHL
ncbi:MAG TPA: hydroxyphenylacetyl-CoA thioesterase PaaI [Alphaproteobacteria bacterium]|nr:hydroxyphenylacetyl-CoA thioesterase PaaI [Alphaproteobacteria bacterium]